MSYKALYRRFRPKSFKDVCGQKHIVQTLKNQIIANRIGHAYLFCGTRGTGKTSIAKILAKAVNCINIVDGNPCNQCDSCNAFNEGRSMNIIEIDAASNNGVDNIRDIRDEVKYTPTQGKYKVYIIDEVHMLSIGAFNALLKTLEEPPSHVIFILATTEPHKIPITIISRCQRYDFKRISIDMITETLKSYMKEDNIEIDEKAVRYIAKAADGSMRDALSILDQCIVFYLEQRLTFEKVLDILGAVDIEIFNKFICTIIDTNVMQCLNLVEEIIIQGRELNQFIIDFTWFLRNLLIIKTVKDPEQILDISDENINYLQSIVKQLSETEIMRYIRIFSELSNTIKYSTQKRVLLEVVLIKLCQPAMDNNNDAILSRISALENKIQNGTVIQTQRLKEDKPSNLKKVDKKPLPKAISKDMQDITGKWQSIIQQLSISMRPYLKKTSLKLDDNILTIICEDELCKGFLENEERKNELKNKLEQNIGKSFDIIYKEKNHKKIEQNIPNEQIYDKIEEKVNFDITYE